jgi:hypothetical protein
MDFSQLKKQSGKSSLEKIASDLSKMNSNQQERKSDDRFWSPTVDKAGNGYAVIRFLPSPAGEDMPFVRVWDHGFQGPTGTWYIENSLTTIGKNDPVSEHNSKLWNSGLESDKEIARKQKRRLHFVSNVYIVNDPGNPENEGKVFLYKYGKKIFDKLNELMNPQFQDEEAINPFDFWAGANFKLKIRQVEGYRNYDKSEFAKPSPLLDDDKELENVWKKEHSLQEFLSPSNFKTYEELSAKLAKVLGTDGSSSGARANAKAKASDEDDAPWAEETEAPKVRSTPAPRQAATDDDEDDGLDFFKSLANR